MANWPNATPFLGLPADLMDELLFVAPVQRSRQIYVERERGLAVAFQTSDGAKVQLKDWMNKRREEQLEKAIQALERYSSKKVRKTKSSLVFVFSRFRIPWGHCDGVSYSRCKNRWLSYQRLQDRIQLAQEGALFNEKWVDLSMTLTSVSYVH